MGIEALADRRLGIGDCHIDESEIGNSDIGCREPGIGAWDVISLPTVPGMGQWKIGDHGIGISCIWESGIGILGIGNW